MHKTNAIACAAVMIFALPAVTRANPVLDPENGDYYPFVSDPGISWDRANQLASNMSFDGLEGYLATITSQSELDFVENYTSIAGTANIYVGGRRIAGTTATWEWATGPLAGTIFWNKGPVAGEFAAWDPVYALGKVHDTAHPDSPGSSALYINSWFRPYFTSAYPWAVPGGISAGGNSGFLVEYSVVPEPSTWAMMLVGFAGLGFAGYRANRPGRPT